MGILRFSDLTDAQKELLCNGCGPKGWGGMRPPQFLFEASCDQHDFYYWRGGNKKDRKKADKDFYAAMKIDAKNAAWYKRPHYYAWAWGYYTAVRVGGRTCFTYLDEMRVMEDLLEFEKRYNEVHDIVETVVRNAINTIHEDKE